MKGIANKQKLLLIFLDRVVVTGLRRPPRLTGSTPLPEEPRRQRSKSS